MTIFIERRGEAESPTAYLELAACLKWAESAVTEFEDAEEVEVVLIRKRTEWPWLGDFRPTNRWVGRIRATYPEQVGREAG